jgi:hypothetical protein
MEGDMEATLLTTMPPLPQIGAEDWGPDLNNCLTWLNQQMAGNSASIEALQDEVETLQGQVSTLQARVTALESRPEYVYNSTAYQFSNAAPPATGNQLRLNNVNATLATMIDMRLIDSDGADRSQWIKLLNIGSRLRINDWNNAAIFHRYNVTGPATLDATNAQVPVTWVDGAGVIPNAKINVGFFVDVSAIAGPSG